MNEKKQTAKCVMLVDADYVDKVAFDLTVNFERMLERPIPKADTAHWADCVALDGGVRPGDNEIRVVLIHRKEAVGLQNFAPGDYERELHGQAFQDQLGEFCFEAYPVEELTTKEDFFADALQTICQQKDVKRLMVIADETYYDLVRNVLRHNDDEARQTTVFSMQPQPGGNFRQELLGYSLMAALGIKGDEIKQY